MTVCAITRNDAAWRLEQLMQTGQDPGARPEVVPLDEASDEHGTVAGSGYDLDQIAMDRIQTFVAERFAGHALSGLVAAVLRAEGYVCGVVDPGPDGGIDIYAGRGPLGLDSPSLVAQVKSSPSPVDVKVVRELHGVLATHGAEQALLVAWGGVNKNAKSELRNQFFRMRVWTATDLLARLIENYARLPEDVRASLPLKQIWTLVEETE